MGMSTRVSGVRDLDGKFAKMARIKEMCDKEKISYPREVEDYFDYPEESVSYNKQEMEEVGIEDLVERNESVEMSDIWEVDLKKLPKEITKIRFANSY